MTFKLIVSDKRTEIISIWENIFSSVTGVTFLTEDFVSFKSNYNLDAIVMLQRHALEQFGGMPAINRSLIINTTNEIGMPNWVVTTAPVNAQLIKQINEDGKIELIDAKNLALQPNQTYITFSKIFDAIKEFNLNQSIKRIGSLGIYLRTINLGTDPRTEAESLLKAYLEKIDALNSPDR